MEKSLYDFIVTAYAVIQISYDEYRETENERIIRICLNKQDALKHSDTIKEVQVLKLGETILLLDKNACFYEDNIPLVDSKKNNFNDLVKTLTEKQKFLLGLV